MSRAVASLAAALAIAAGLLGCGGGDGAEPGAPEGATLVLDFQPNAVHAPLYYAQAQGYFSDEGVDLTIREPSSSADSAKLLEAGRADLAILDVNDFGIARERGLNLVAVAAIVQRPLASVIAGDPDRISKPADLDGATVGVTGVPSDDAVLDTVLAAGGLAPDAAKRVTIGFTAVPALAAGRIDAATAFWNAEGVQLRQRGIPTTEFRVDELGAPRYPELVLAVRGDRTPDDEQVTCAVLRALGSGYLDLKTDPQRALDAMLGEVDGLDADNENAQYAELVAGDAFSPREGLDPDPALQRHATSAWAEWAAQHGVIDDRGAVEPALLTNELRRCAVSGDSGTG